VSFEERWSVSHHGGSEACDGQGDDERDDSEDDASDKDAPTEAVVVGKLPLAKLPSRGLHSRERERFEPRFDDGIERRRWPGRL
jgi:hypothetical protein